MCLITLELACMTSVSVCLLCVSMSTVSVFLPLCFCLEAGFTELDADGGTVDSGWSWFGSGFG